ncbi:acyl-CoA dehydrogenase family protein [Methylocapsa sp. S129]|uniref:acyl-CoA dehydrogenase family protein n=1 Tax=Methylocapsa sp. S129 TaxID=1641869 RepID=UPI001FEF0698|nr:acyl-CoA dehydrogenase family protein [Methylocapsa sp. S129]
MKLDLATEALASVEALLAQAIASVRARVSEGGRLSAPLIEREQRAAHGLAWLATYVEAIREMTAYALRMRAEGRFGEIEILLTRIGLGEYCAQIFGGIPMSQGEILRLADFGLDEAQVAPYRTAAIAQLIESGNIPETRASLASLIERSDNAATIGDPGLDETFEAIRAEMRRFADAEVIPHAQGWHRTNAYIPMEVIEGLSGMGVFGLTIPEDYGGMGLGKVAMCVVSEELSRAYIGVGSLGTRSEIAAELILVGGTPEQKRELLPKIASGAILPTAVFTEPNTGSDLASLRTRAIREGDVYKISGAKTWITHPVRADLMTLLARTNPNEPGYKGLSMFLARKPRGSDAEPFPAKGMSGGEIEVLGYRGMKEYEIAFDGFEIPAEALLGGEEGQGFKQLMATFESARIQTAARAVGVAQSAMELGLRYAKERTQFGKKLIAFPRVADKIAMMAVEIHIARQITYFAGRAKDEGRRCDMEAGMAKLLAARVAWAAADNALQIHGGNGFALEYPISRVLCDARILNIFEGAAEIQAQVIARRLLEGGN